MSRMPSLPGDSCASMATLNANFVGVTATKHAQIQALRRIKKLRRTSMTRESHLTTMLLTVNFFFILTTLPITVSNILYCVFEQERDDSNLAQIIGRFQTVSHLLNYLNITVHFVLYCLSGRAFRDDVLVLLRLKKPSPSAKRPLERLTSIQPDYNTCAF